MIAAAVVGGFLAAGAGWFVDIQRDNRRLKRLKALLAAGIVLDLRSSDDLYKDLLNEYRTFGYISFAKIQALRESRHIYDQNKNWIILFSEEEYKEIFNYYTKTSSLLSSLEHLEPRRYKLQATVVNSATSAADKQDATREFQQIGQFIERNFTDFSDALKSVMRLEAVLNQAAASSTGSII